MTKKVKLDLRGEDCPSPLIKTSKTITSLSKGDIIEILTDKEECVNLIKELIELLNVEKIFIDKTDNYWIIKTII